MKSKLISGLFVVGVRPTLLLDDISLLLGIDLAGGRVIPDPISTHEPDYSDDKEENLQLYPAYAVTRSMSSRNSASQEQEKPRPVIEDVNLVKHIFCKSHGRSQISRD